MFFGRIWSKKPAPTYNSVLQDDHEGGVHDFEVNDGLNRPRFASSLKENLGWLFLVISCVLHFAHWYFVWQKSEARCHDGTYITNNHNTGGDQ